MKKYKENLLNGIGVGKKIMQLKIKLEGDEVGDSIKLEGDGVGDSIKNSSNGNQYKLRKLNFCHSHIHVITKCK